MNEKKETTQVIMTEGKYGILLIPNNWVVAELNKGTTSQACVRGEDFGTNSYTYHANIQQAIINLSDRLVKDRIKDKAANRPLELRELVELMHEKDAFMRKAILGRARITSDTLK